MNNLNDSPNKIKELVQKYPKLLEKTSIDISKYWYNTLENLCECIQNYIDRSETYIDGKKVFIPQVKCVQVKQKFGTFRFYIDIQEATINGMIKLAAQICENTCEHCGSNRDLGYTTHGYVTVCCKECSSNFKNWSSKNEIYASRSN